MGSIRGSEDEDDVGYASGRGLTPSSKDHDDEGSDDLGAVGALRTAGAGSFAPIGASEKRREDRVGSVTGSTKYEGDTDAAFAALLRSGEASVSPRAMDEAFALLLATPDGTPRGGTPLLSGVGATPDGMPRTDSPYEEYDDDFEDED